MAALITALRGKSAVLGRPDNCVLSLNEFTTGKGERILGLVRAQNGTVRTYKRELDGSEECCHVREECCHVLMVDGGSKKVVFKRIDEFQRGDKLVKIGTDWGPKREVISTYEAFRKKVRQNI